jgi:putative SOS response-associated peptidase YedK
MCFHSKQSASALALKQRFNAIFENETAFQPTTYNGFEHPKTPIITSQKQDTIQLYSWGLIPHWAKDDSIRKHTLNAKSETIHEKPSFRDIVQNRCLVLIDGFYEWKWLDEKGKHKQKYLITLPTHEAFACAGLYSHWMDKNTGETINTYTILTTEANGLMSEIHNSKKRMPVIIHSSNEQSWLLGEAHKFTHINLMATEV